jgi:hypothetical protein
MLIPMSGKQTRSNQMNYVPAAQVKLIMSVMVNSRVKYDSVIRGVISKRETAGMESPAQRTFTPPFGIVHHRQSKAADRSQRRGVKTLSRVDDQRAEANPAP